MPTRLIVAICVLCLAGCSTARGGPGSPPEKVLLASTAAADYALLADRPVHDEAPAKALESTPAGPTDDSRQPAGHDTAADDRKQTLTAVGVVLILLSVISLVAVGATL